MANDQNEYLCTLQLPAGAPLAVELECRRARAFEVLGVDATGLYPPHVTVTGFFTATAEQAAAVVATINTLVRRTDVHDWATLAVELRQCIETDGGHVLLDVRAPCIASLAANLAIEAKSFGVNIRPKAVRHLSLASGRDANERQRVMQFFSDLPVGRFDFELVVARLLCRSNLDKLRNSREQHSFSELVRLPLASLASVCPVDSGPASIFLRRSHEALLLASLAATSTAMTVGDVITPLKGKRKALDLETRPITTGQLPEERASDEDTPPKIARAPDGEAMHVKDKLQITRQRSDSISTEATESSSHSARSPSPPGSQCMCP